MNVKELRKRLKNPSLAGTGALNAGEWDQTRKVYLQVETPDGMEFREVENAGYLFIRGEFAAVISHV